MNAIELDNLHKEFDGLAVLRGVELRVGQGEIYGLLGTNGAGKSTLMHLLLGFLRPDRGQIRILGTTNIERVCGRIGYLPERLRYHLRYSAREYLRFLGGFNGMTGEELRRRVDDELAAVGLSEAADRQLATFSRGMLQRVGIAQALLHEPELLLIDEPTGGLDPAGQAEMLNLLADLRRRGCSVLLTTHYLLEIEQVCDRVGVLAEGRMAAEANVAALQTASRDVLITVPEMPVALVERLAHLSPAVRIEQRAIMISPNTAALQAHVLRALLDADVAVLGLAPQQTPLADLYNRAIRGEDVRSLYQSSADTTALPAEPALPDALFAPPGHPDAAPHRNGDSLLNELLQRSDEGDQS